jgi:Cu2+-exporting ATPase
MVAALSAAARLGVLVKNVGDLEVARKLTGIVFDKTGTLTTGRLELADATPLQALSARELDVLYTLVAASSHPKSMALQRALVGGERRLLGDGCVVETPGCGLRLNAKGAEYRLGARAWALGTAAQAGDESSDLVFACDGQKLCTLRTRESLRSDARDELNALARAGYGTWILSGDAPARVRTLAQDLPVDPAHALGGLGPSDKARWIAEHDRGDILMIGDGINDSLAVQQAFASGTPSIDRAFMPWRTDFYFVTPGLAPIGLALRAAKKLARVVQRNQVFAVTYNVLTVAFAMTGHMRPWMAAVLMPLSSLVVLATTSWSLSTRSRLWTS